MAYWNPDFSDRDEVLAAHRRGSGVTIVLAVLILLETGLVYFMENVFAPSGLVEPDIVKVASGVAEAAFALFVAWRFQVGKGAFTGALLLLALALGVVLQVLDGELTGLVIALVIMVGLFHAVRAAFTVRAWPQDEADRFV